MLPLWPFEASLHPDWTGWSACALQPDPDNISSRSRCLAVLHLGRFWLTFFLDALPIPRPDPFLSLSHRCFAVFGGCFGIQRKAYDTKRLYSQSQ